MAGYYLVLILKEAVNICRDATLHSYYYQLGVTNRAVSLSVPRAGTIYNANASRPVMLLSISIQVDIHNKHLDYCLLPSEYVMCNMLCCNGNQELRLYCSPVL